VGLQKKGKSDEVGVEVGGSREWKWHSWVLFVAYEGSVE